MYLPRFFVVLDSGHLSVKKVYLDYTKKIVSVHVASGLNEKEFYSR